MTRLLALEAGPLALTIAPEIGGAIASFRHERADLLRPMGEDALARGLVRASACFPLLPYCNRIAQGRFRMGGTSFQLTRNFGDHPHAIHGNGWQRSWTVEAASETGATLVLDHDPFGFGPAGWDGWPFRYRAEQRFTLSTSRLLVELSVRNRDDGPMPVGLGWHPYFPARTGATLRFVARDLWRTDPDGLPTGLAAIGPDADFSEPRPVAATGLDTCFNGWDGRASIAYPHERVAITMTASPRLDRLVVFTPRDRDFFAVEPVSTMTDAVNRRHEVADNGLAVLAPGETLAVWMELAAEPLP